jgi:hypothetical protein
VFSFVQESRAIIDRIKEHNISSGDRASPSEREIQGEIVTVLPKSRLRKCRRLQVSN